MKLLLATGMPDLNAELTEALAGRMEVEECYNRLAVYDVAGEKDADTVLISQNLPGNMDLVEIVRLLRSAGKRVVVMPGSPDMRDTREVIKQVLPLGVYDFVYDPVSVDGIIYRLKNPGKLGDVPAELVREAMETETVSKGVPDVPETMDGGKGKGIIGKVTGIYKRKKPEGETAKASSTGKFILLAAGDDTKPLKQELQKKGATIEVCHYREQLPGAVRKRKAGAVILSASLPGAVDLADLIPALGGVRVILLPGARDDPQAVKTARKAARLGVKDIAWDCPGAVELVFHPAVEADLPADPEDKPEERVAPGTGKPPGKNQTGGNILFRILSALGRHKEPVPLPAEVEPVRTLPPPPAIRAAVLGLAVDFPTVPVEEAQVIICSPERAAEALSQAPPGAKVYLAGEGAAIWRDALRLGITPVTPDKIRELVMPAVPDPRLQINRKCLLVYSSKTSVGKTSISVTAAALVARRGKKVCLVDLDGDGRTASWLFLGNRAVPGERFYPTRWGVDVICLPDETKAYNRLAAYALNNYDAVVVDCPGRLQMPRAAEAFMGAAMVLLVSSCNSASVAAVQGFIEGKMGEYEIGDRTALVINRSEKLPPLQPGDVRRLVGFEPADELPFDPLVDRMFSAGTPLPVIKAKKKPFENAVMELLQKHLPEVLYGEDSNSRKRWYTGKLVEIPAGRA